MQDGPIRTSQSRPELRRVSGFRCFQRNQTPFSRRPEQVRAAAESSLQPACDALFADEGRMATLEYPRGLVLPDGLLTPDSASPLFNIA